MITVRRHTLALDPWLEAVIVERTNMVLWGWLLLSSGALTLVLLTYRFIWLERYRYPFRMAHSAVRLRGRITGQTGAVVYCTDANGEELLSHPFTLERPDGPAQLVAPQGAVLDVRARRHRQLGRLRGIRVGDRVTIDGIPTTLRQDERLYRQAGRVPVVEAVRIAGGSWPELCWLRFPAAAGALIFLVSLGQVLFTPSGDRASPFDGVDAISAQIRPGQLPTGLRRGHREDAVFTDDFFSPLAPALTPGEPAREQLLFRELVHDPPY